MNIGDMRVGSLPVIAACVCAVLVIIAIMLTAPGGSSQGEDLSSTVPGAEGISVYPVKVDGVPCLVASNGGSGDIALSCDWGG